MSDLAEYRAPLPLDSGILLLWGPWKANTQVNSVRKLQQFLFMRVEAMLVVLSHTLRMEFTVQLFNRRSMYCVDMFPKIMLQGGGGGGFKLDEAKIRAKGKV